MLALLLWWTPLAAGQDCLRPVGTDEFLVTLDQAEAAFVDLEEDRFLDGMQRASLLLPCLDDGLPEVTAARYHRAQGLLLYTTDREELALEAFRAARALDPDYRFPEAMFPEGHALRAAYDALPTEDPTWAPPRPRDGRLAFDGRDGRRPTDRPTLFQHLDDGGAALSTRYVRPSEPLPPYPATPRRRQRLLAVGAGALATGAALYGGAWAARSSFYGAEDPTLADLQRQRAITNGLWGGSLAASTLGALTVTLAVVGEDAR